MKTTMKTTTLLVLAGALVAGSSCAQVTPSAFTEACESAASQATAANVAGADPDWLFLKSELAHLGIGAFAGEPAATEAAKEIASYNQQLKDLGVRLVFVPVPAKAAIYPEKFLDGATAADVAPNKPFLDKLAAEGVEVIDLEPVFRAARASGDGGRKVYCAQDAHWSPYGAELAAAEIAKVLGGAPELAGVPKIPSLKVGAVEDLQIKGDLAFGGFAGMARETVTLRRAGTGEGDQIARLDEDPSSPLLLLGDSHLEVFTVGGAEMHTTAAGLRDHLQAELGFAMDRVNNRNSGADSARANLVRRAKREADFWETKKVVVWCFSIREITQGKWRPIPAQMP
ncbi:hypothetical protein BH23VER1_BH23VER1_35550 [soil metagenome]